ncbi:MAG: hypothetical protein IT380_29910 [Myxococcales bacterium]|nr:hypothetical protein [Myxococcales bacterium]
MLMSALVVVALHAMDPAPTVKAEAPAETVPAGKPTWCDGVSVNESSPPTKLVLASEMYDGMTLEAMKEVARASCVDVDDPTRLAWVQAVRQSLSNQYGLSLADNERVMKLAVTLHGGASSWKKPSSPSEDPGCQQLAPLMDGTLSQRFSRVLERTAIDCGDWRSRENRAGLPSHFGSDYPPYWLVDFDGGFTSELAKASFVNEVLTDFKSLSKSAQQDLRYYTPWVNAAGVTLDDAKFRQQLAAMKLPETSAVRALLGFRRAVTRFERQRAFIEDAAKQRKGVEAFFLSGPAAARARWATESAANATLRDQVLALEEKRGAQPGGMNGCAKTLFAAFEPWMKAAVKVNPQVTPLELTMGDYVGSQLAYGLSLCGLNDAEAPVLDEVFSYYFHRSPLQRGSIAASQAGSVEGFNLATTKKLSLPEHLAPAKPVVNPPGLDLGVRGSLMPFDPHQLSSGVVAAMKAKGAVTTLTFKAETRKEPKLECGNTDKVWRITPGGTRIFEYKCKKVGETTVTGAPAPITVPTWAVGGIKVGTAVRFWPSQADGDRGWVIEAFADKSMKKRVNLLGARL